MEKYKNKIRKFLDMGYGIFVGLVIANPPTLEEPRVGRTYFLLALCFVDAYINSKNKRRRNVNIAVIALLAIAMALVKLYVVYHAS